MIDTHTHIYTEEFAADREETLQRALAAGVTHMLLPAIDLITLPDLMALCQQHPDCCHPMMGLHPTEIPENGANEALDQMESLLMTPDSPFVAVGEIGLDLYWDDTRLEEQLQVFRRQLEWAACTGLPVSIHARSAHRPLIDAMLPFESRLTGGVFHCFGGSAEEAQELLTAFPRFALGIGGVVTFKKSSLPQTLAATVPLERIVLETDAPYLSPAPHRGKRNEPSFLPHIVEKLADTYSTTTDHIVRTTTATACHIFHLS